MSALINETIDKIRKDLKFPVEIQEWENEWEAMMFDPKSKTHTILLPKNRYNTGKDSVSQERMGFVHELIHAKFSEEIHPVFGGSIVDCGKSMDDFSEDDELGEEIALITYRYACDWFVWHETIKLLPIEGRNALKELFEDVSEFDNTDELYDFDMTLFLAFGLATAYHWLGEDISNYVNTYHPLNDKALNMIDLVDCFLQTPSEKPTTELLKDLINKCISVVYDYKVKLEDEVLPIWIVYQ